MDWVLFALTTSLAAAVGFGIVTWRLLREDRRRARARVAALSDAIDVPPAGAGLKTGPYTSSDAAAAGAELRAGGGPKTIPHSVSDSADVSGDLRAGAGLETGPYTVSDSAEVDPADVGAGLQAGPRQRPPFAVPVAAMFTTEPGKRLGGRPLIKAAVVGVMAVIVVVAAAMGTRDRPASAAAVAQAAAPLELMSMRHVRDGTTLTVTGLVRNPPAGAEARRVAAVVFVFDRGGGFVTSGRAPLDFVVLEPGGESPFVVTIPNVADVARYRVSFRTETGVVRHVDRRAEQLQLATQ